MFARITLLFAALFIWGASAADADRIVVLQHGWSPWWVARQHTDNSANSKRFTYLNPVTHKVIRVVDSKGRFTKAQYKLPAGTLVKIPASLVSTRDFIANHESIKDICQKRLKGEGCIEKLSVKNRVKDASSPLTATLQVPLSFQVIVAKQTNKTSSPSPVVTSTTAWKTLKMLLTTPFVGMSSRIGGKAVWMFGFVALLLVLYFYYKQAQRKYLFTCDIRDQFAQTLNDKWNNSPVYPGLYKFHAAVKGGLYRPRAIIDIQLDSTKCPSVTMPTISDFMSEVKEVFIQLRWGEEIRSLVSERTDFVRIELWRGR